MVSDCLTVVQGWRSSVERKDDYRNVAAGFWRLLSGKIPGEILKVKSHRTKAQAAAIGLEESLRRGGELVDGLARSECRGRVCGGGHQSLHGTV